MNTKHLIIHLIREQIRNQTLILAFENLGFDCTMYTLNISEVILTLVGFTEKTDAVYNQYFELLEKAVEETTYLNLDDIIGKWSVVIYNRLIELKSNELYP